MAVPTLLPTNPVDFFTALWPLAHIFTAAQTIEACAKRRASAPRAARRRNRRYSTSVTDARLGARKAAGFVVASLGSVLLILLTQCRDRYPLGDWHHACRPCVCDGDGALLNCDVPGDIDVWVLELKDMGITRIEPGAFEGNKQLLYLYIYGNKITELEPGAVRRAHVFYIRFLFNGAHDYIGFEYPHVWLL